MFKNFRKVYPLYVFVDLFFMAVSFYGPYTFKVNSLYSSYETTFRNFKEYSFIFILWAVFICISLNRRNLYSTDRGLNVPKEMLRVMLSVSWSAILISGIIFFTQYKFFSRGIFLSSFVLLCIFLSGWRISKRLILRKLISEGFHNINIIVIGAGKVGKLVLEEIKRMPWFGFRLVGFLDDSKVGFTDNIPILGKLNDFSAVAKKYFIDEVVVTIPSEKSVVTELIKKAKKLHVGVRVVPEDFEKSLPVLDVSYLGVVPLLTYKERIIHPAELALKRFFDIVVSLMSIMFLVPLFFVISIAIKLTSKGPIFYVSKRMGCKGRIFNFYKFRSMVNDADSLKSELLDKNEIKDGVIFKIKKDPRVTRVGYFLRRSSLDELPQLFNVFKGDMSIVGPRPFPVDESNKFQSEHIQRLNIRPGITGLSQVKGRSTLTFRKWIRWDLWYLTHWSFALDLRIILWTVPVILKRKGAY